MEKELTVEIVTISKNELEQMFKIFSDKIDKKFDSLESSLKLQNCSTQSYLTALEFMEKVRIKRSKFDKLIQSNTIKYLKQDRRYLIPAEEVESYISNFKNSK